MAIPPFPSQDLAKLVLGYLAEEQLMTAYDEFLQASPYLDALGNEYDRIFMTSLKNILAEYRAVKIFVETCKPVQLRKRLFQCHNLLDLVKYLIQHIDANKIHEHNETKQGVDRVQNSYSCEVCKSPNHICSCKRNQYSLQTKHEASNIENCIETTTLSDLPGTTGSTKNIQIAENMGQDLNQSKVLSDTSSTHSDIKNSTITSVVQSYPTNIIPKENQVKNSNALDLKQKEEFNIILNQVCHKNNSQSNSEISTIAQNKKLFSDDYKSFVTGVNGGESTSADIPDSSTSENIHAQKCVSTNTQSITNTTKENVKQTRTQYLLKVANVKNQTNEVVSINTVTNCSRTISNTDEKKIKILSDIKVDNSYANEVVGTLKMPTVLKNATSTPLLQMQTIVINGTPVFKQNLIGQPHNFTKDEIMAMPTIILAPDTGDPPTTKEQALPSSTIQQPNNIVITDSDRQLGPLTIDITDSSNDNNTDCDKVDIIEPNQITECVSSGHKIIDITSASAPKDNTTSITTEASTPQVMPMIRKSSSTPRRTSHVRVLDFTTPRRILTETINKCVPSTTTKEVDIVINTSPNNTYRATNQIFQDGRNTPEVISGPTKENTVQRKIFTKRKNWDTDLRALIRNQEEEISLPKPKHKIKTPKIQTSKKEQADKTNKRKSTKKKSTANDNLEPEPELLNKSNSNKKEVLVKPTINIIAGEGLNSSSNNLKKDKKSSIENADTPEMERMSIQNEIGSKLNISDLLETPYKQVLYDIQMETPRFLGPDLPDDPMSDVKIMNIPTPRFLNAPTPSTYSSRPTDYSSGGSYYKPDDQDYMRITDDMDCPVSSSVVKPVQPEVRKNISSLNDNGNKIINEKIEKRSRPIRQCRKNVSYRNSSLNTITKGRDEKNSDSLSDDNSDFMCTPLKDIKNKDNKTKMNNKSDKKKSMKYKSPLKKEMSKSFMKIRPRKPTPVKKDGKRKTKTPSSLKADKKKKCTKQANEVNITPIAVPIPTKSRRKSSTPRKIHCTKTFNLESSNHGYTEIITKRKDIVAVSKVITNDSDTEQLHALHWSDDGSQEAKLKETQSSSGNEIEDINKIQEYIKTTTHKADSVECDENLHIDLVERGFDLETAKIIERELLDTSPQKKDVGVKNIVLVEKFVDSKKISIPHGDKNLSAVIPVVLESDCSANNSLQIVAEDEDDGDEIELSVHESHEKSSNYFHISYDDIKEDICNKKELAKLKDKFSMEVCLDDDLSIRLRATSYTLLFDRDPEPDALYQYETEMAVRSITNVEKLYTPIKESIKAQCYEIFDSTLTSLDTPLKAHSPKRKEADKTVSEMVSDVDKVEPNEKNDRKKRKRTSSDNLSDDTLTESKKNKTESKYLLSANIKNIDIESVLTKLHGS
ncbi:hypothetical protein ACJJTC_013692 [Scirpophaga incertulas]